jgi:hypothetical protein
MPTILDLKEKREKQRVELAQLAGADSLDDAGRERFDALDKEIRSLDGDILRLERAAEYERRAAPAKIIHSPEKAEREYADLVGKFEMRQVALCLDEGRALSARPPKSFPSCATGAAIAAFLCHGPRLSAAPAKPLRAERRIRCEPCRSSIVSSPTPPPCAWARR